MHRHAVPTPIDINRFPHTDALGRLCSRQTTFENIAAKEEIAQNQQFHHLPQCFLFCSAIIPAVIEIVHIFALKCSKSSATYLLYVGKG